mgnify:CR=1 FL=1
MITNYKETFEQIKIAGSLAAETLDEVTSFVKPGITGLAQVKGFRGEIETDEDIINRVKYDIYYLENWSLILDLNIVFLTTINFLTGQKKAY